MNSFAFGLNLGNDKLLIRFLDLPVNAVLVYGLTAVEVILDANGDSFLMLIGTELAWDKLFFLLEAKNSELFTCLAEFGGDSLLNA
jgi:hypothetical protein